MDQGKQMIGWAAPTHVRRAPVRVALLLMSAATVAACTAESAPGDPGDATEAVAPADAARESSAVAEDTAPGPADAPSHGAGGARDPGGAPADEAADAAAIDWTQAPTRVARPQAGIATLRAVRTARHRGFDRIVLDFGDDAVPGYGVESVKRVIQCGSGDTIEVAGAASLVIGVTPASAHTDEGMPTIADRDRAPGLPAVRALRLICDFEGHVDWAVGLASMAGYRVFELRDPARLVVDVRHPGGS